MNKRSLRALLAVIGVSAASTALLAQAQQPRSDAGRAATPARTADAGTRATPTPRTGAPADAGTGSARLTADQVAAQIQAFYDRTRDVEADFAQTYVNKLYNKTERSRGRVFFRKPGQMRWEYAQPSGNLIVSDGETMWVYEAEARQAYRRRVTDSELPTALSFLTGTGRLATDFTFRLLDARRQNFPEGIVLELRPRRANPHYDRLLFYVDPQTFQVRRTLIIDPQGNRNRFDFLRMRYNRGIPATRFRWNPPRGTRIITP
ncbi:MAG: outer membrane lipoprotein carrier protein LolA [Deltaproteobacteria bacterium]|nr:outer membrane lipoprotein carrier protein LolA [Deltaproteobacteria bacterium]